MSKIILALDQATRDSGWSVFDNGKLIDFGHWSFSDDDVAMRINRLCQEIEKKIDEYEPNLVAIENIQLQQNIEMFQKLAWVQGALMCTCITKNVPYQLIRPSEWRAICDFLKENDKHRDNQKKIAQEWVLTTFQKKCTQDEADAICIGYALSKQEDNDLNFE